MSSPDKIASAVRIISQYIADQEEILSTGEIKEIVEKYRPTLDALFEFNKDDYPTLLRELETRHVTTMDIGVSLTDREDEHDEDWCPSRDDSTWKYWNDYKQLLVQEGWPDRVLHSMDTVTDKVLGLLRDPEDEGEWYRRGLVIGHVQSGKTANYIGLLSKAADAGYKFIIVIAGIHNNLRKQTQERIDQGFIGKDSQNRALTGVGRLNPSRNFPSTVTTTESDFNRNVGKQFGVDLKSIPTLILVIKKNVRTLESLYEWLVSLNTRKGMEKIGDIPMLLIDDEADNASINTNKPELNPTRTNAEIRRIMNLFRKRCYVGYTATPFANIFINPEDENEMLGDELFPKDFIYCLDAPTNYFGADRIFTDGENGNNFIRNFEDCEKYIPMKHKKDDPLDELPPSLKEALRVFVISRAVRNLRGQTNKHASMMVNVSRFVNIQKQIRLLMEMYLQEIGRAVKFNCHLPSEKAVEDSTVALFKNDFLKEYSDCDVSWEEILKELGNAAESVKLFMVNSQSDESLDYSACEKDGDALTAVAVGGLSLSRGLTLEGLTVTYFYRNSKMYDTLMQMGRWFGYRDKYEGLCRIYMPKESQGWYEHIAEATEELRLQVKRMRRERKRPVDFGLYVRSHPESLIVTALNKMRHAEKRSFKISYDGTFKETHIVPSSENSTAHNRALINDFYTELKDGKYPNVETALPNYLFKDIEWLRIYKFVLEEYRFHCDHREELQNFMSQFIKEVSDLHPLWDVAFISLKKRMADEGFPIAAQDRTVRTRSQKTIITPESEPGWYIGYKQRVAGTKVMGVGLSDDELRKADELAVQDNREEPTDIHYRNARGRPLLLIHLLDLWKDQKNDDKPFAKNIPVIGFSFPNSKEFRTVECIVSPVWLKQFEPEQFDSPDDDEDYDPPE